MGDVTELIARARTGDRAAFDGLFELLYPELRRIAHARLARNARDVLLDTTALVHECYLKFAQAARLTPTDRVHFLGYEDSGMTGWEQNANPASFWQADIDEAAESHVVIQARVVYDNLRDIKRDLEAIVGGSRQPVDVSGRTSAAWGQPRLSAYLRWKRAARKAA